MTCYGATEISEGCDAFGAVMTIAGRCGDAVCEHFFELPFLFNDPAVVGAGQEFEIVDFIIRHEPGVEQYEPPGKIKLYYTDQSGLDRSATVTCTGIPPKP